MFQIKKIQLQEAQYINMSKLLQLRIHYTN